MELRPDLLFRPKAAPGLHLDREHRRELCKFRPCDVATNASMTGARFVGLWICGTIGYEVKMSDRAKCGVKCTKKVSLEAQTRTDSVADFFCAKLHRPLQPSDAENAEESLRNWLLQAFDVANEAFFGGDLSPGVHIELDRTWHLRGGAGGAHPGRQKIVLDPSVHSSYRDISATLLHEMLHLHVQDAGEEHGPVFLQACLDLNEKIMLSNAATFCRLGEFDTALDRSLIKEVGASEDIFDALLQLNASSAWDSGLLVGDLQEACRRVGMPKHEAFRTAARLGSKMQSLAVINSCRIALEKGYSTWSIRSRTMAQYCAQRTCRDYQSFADYRALWSL
eukprot:Skav207355  [mRNA]  locus=scaffold426:176282:177292:- [translate_table: standard]